MSEYGFISSDKASAQEEEFVERIGRSICRVLADFAKNSDDPDCEIELGDDEWIYRTNQLSAADLSIVVKLVRDPGNLSGSSLKVTIPKTELLPSGYRRNVGKLHDVLSRVTGLDVTH